MKTMEKTEKLAERRPYCPPTLAMRHFSPQTAMSVSNNKEPDLEDRDNWIYGDL